ncbi:MAG: site-specific integrase [Desulfobacterales bacterium]|nr:site-specific integrase [Desulfobacterales bacterium]
MKGHVRTNEKCVKCKGKFEISPTGLVCPDCLITPTRYFVDIYFKGRIKIYKDENGIVLDSWERASRLLNHIRWEIDNHVFNPDKYHKTQNLPFLFETYVKKWLKEQKIRLKANEIAEGTYYKSKMVAEKYLIPHFKLEDIRHITTRNIKDFSLHLAETRVKGNNLMSPKYREYVLGLLRNIFYDGLRSGDLLRSQIPMFPVVESQPKYFDYLTEDEQDKILEKIPEYDFPIFHMITTYGIRPSEVRALKRDCVYDDFKQIVIKRTFTRNNRLRENPKENRWRVISLLDETRAILRGLEINLSGFVFVNKWNRCYSQQYLNDVWNKACTDAGFRYIPLKNASRHSLGTKLAMEGYGADIIAKVLGHSDIKTTRHYTRYASETFKPFYQRRNIKKAEVHEFSVGGSGDD